MPRTDPLVLVVEDDAAVRNLMLTTLEARGYAHQSAATARAALASAATSRSSARSAAGRRRPSS